MQKRPLVTQLSSEGFSKQRSYIEFGSFINYFATIHTYYTIMLCGMSF